MKTAMKRLLSFVLVAMMLISVVPFQASAVETAGTNELVFVNADGTELARELVGGDKNAEGYKGNDPLTGTWYENFGDQATCTKKSELAGSTVYHQDYQVDIKVTFSGIIDETSKEITVKGPISGNDDAIKATITAKIGENVPSYDTLYNTGSTVISGNGNNYTVTVVPKTAADWKVYVVLDGTVHESTESYVLAPTANDPLLAAALEAVKATVDQSKKNITEGSWVINEAEKTATINLTTADKPVVKPEYTITFRYCDKYECNKCTTVVSDSCNGVVEVKVNTVNQEITSSMVPQATERYGYVFNKWVNAASETDDTPVDVYTGDATFNAVYTKGTSNTHRVTVYGVIYREGDTTTMSTPLAITYAANKADLLTQLNNQKSEIQATLDALGKTTGNGYSWDGVTFYDDDDLDSDDRVVSGTQVKKDGVYYVKVKYTGNDKVQLYVHTSKTMTIKDTITLKTFTPDETIYLKDIKNAVKNAGWSYGTLRAYDLQSWEKIVDEDSSAVADEKTSFRVEYGETEIHVYLTGANSGSVNNSDNPKTGDAILMAVTVMGLSATALAAVYFVFKKKQSV